MPNPNQAEKYESFNAHSDEFSRFVDKLDNETSISVVIPITGHELLSDNFLNNLVDLSKQSLVDQTEVIYIVNNSSQDKEELTDKYKLNLTLIEILSCARSGDYKRAADLMGLASEERQRFISALSKVKVGYIDLATTPFPDRKGVNNISRAREIGELVVKTRYDEQSRDGIYIMMDADTSIRRDSFNKVASALKVNPGVVKILLDQFPGEGGIGIWSSQASERFNTLLKNLDYQVLGPKQTGWFAKKVSDIRMRDDIRTGSIIARDMEGMHQNEIIFLSSIFRTANRARGGEVGGQFGKDKVATAGTFSTEDIFNDKFEYPRWVQGTQRTQDPPTLIAENTVAYLRSFLDELGSQTLDNAINKRMREESFLHSRRRELARKVMPLAFKTAKGTTDINEQKDAISRWIQNNSWVIDTANSYETEESFIELTEESLPEIFHDFSDTYFGLPTAILLGVSDFLNQVQLEPEKFQEIDSMIQH